MFAFKEWTLICAALARGEQSIILRKRGIAEGRAGFRFQHADFLLFPTLLHEQVNKLRLPVDTPLPAARADGQHEIAVAAHVEWTADVTDWDKVCALEPYHLWTRAEIEKRFQQDDKLAVSLAFVRIAALSTPHVFADAPRYGGCRSWIDVPGLTPGTKLVPVLDDATHTTREAAIRALL